MPYLSIWHFVDHRRYGAFPEEVSFPVWTRFLHHQLFLLQDHVSLAYVIGGNFMTRLLFITHFKAILNHSEHFFRLHLITDKENREDIDVLLKTWNVTNCQFRKICLFWNSYNSSGQWWFYNLEDYEERVKWIPNTHYSKYYGLSKLLIPEIISENVGKVGWPYMLTNLLSSISGDVHGYWHHLPLWHFLLVAEIPWVQRLSIARNGREHVRLVSQQEWKEVCVAGVGKRTLEKQW